MKRLGYRKSRNGCLLCKKRRVKCDEQRPCSACVRHGVSCSLEGSGGAGGTEGSSAPKPVSSLRSSPRTLSRVNSPSSVSSDAPKPASLPPSTSSSSSKQGISPGAFGDVDLNVSFLHASPSEPTGTPQALEYGQPALIDLELMHHYTAHAYRSFPHTSTVPDFFQTNVPRLALRHRFLLHQTLAIAAFHLMHVTPDLPPEYFQRATHHLTKALSGIRAALTAEMTFESGKALFAASSLLLSSTYASRQHLPADGIIDDLIGMVALYHGTSSIQRIAVEKLSKNLFHEVFGDQLHEPAAIEPWLSEYTSELKVLKSYILAAPDLPGNVRSAALHGTQILLDSPWTLTETDRAIPSTVETLILYRWPFWATDDYLQLVRQREPAALATLIFYSAIMRRAEDKCWFLKGWAARIAEAATEFLEGTPWALYTRWAFRVIETGS